MGDSFLGDLANQLSSQFNLGENTTTSLDTIADNGQTVKFGSLGDFASRFDQSAERRYLEEGYLRRDQFNTDPKQYETIWQEPNATVLVKKRMFSSVADNFRPEFMDADERLYYKAMRVLFQNKCNQVAALEKLSKIQQVTAAVGSISDQLVPVIITMSDIASSGFGSGSNLFGAMPGSSNPYTTQDAGQFFKTVDRLRVLYAYNQAAKYTTWLTDSTNFMQSTWGGGSGTMEITNFARINTTTTIDIRSPGHFNLAISDPYQAMLITDYDIELAISDATNLFYNKKSFQFGLSSITDIISTKQAELNSIRNARRASPLTFKIDADTLLGKRVTVIIDRLGVELQFTYDPTGGVKIGPVPIPGMGGFGNSVTVDPNYLKGGEVAGYDGLDTGNAPMGPDNNIRRLVSASELTIFQTIITSIFQQLQLMGNSQNAVSVNNNQFDHVRRRMRAAFLGYLIIQPMDVVHIYMNSKTQHDNKILAGLQQMFSGSGILQSFGNTLTSLKNSWDTLFNPSGNLSIQAEKSIYVGPNFPNYLWSLVRNQFVNEKEGTHVFAGVVQEAKDNWSKGVFNVDVTGQDNTYYFDQGVINFVPGADNFNGLVYDPLTPFKSTFDSVTTNPDPLNSELLNENKFLLSETGANTRQSIVSYKQGSLAGQKATQANYIQDQSINPITGRLTRTFYAPDGLVYKWKQGIGIFTRQGSTSTINDPNLIGVLNPYNNAMAQLDVMNVLSLLVSGVPYNFATYHKAAGDLANFGPDAANNKQASKSFIQSLKNDLATNNALWGNFIPFKNLTMNESAVAQMMQAQLTINKDNTDLNQKIAKLKDYQTAVTQLGAVNALSQKINAAENISVNPQIDLLQSKISSLTTDINHTLSGLAYEAKTAYSNMDRGSAYGSNDDPADSQARKLIRKQTNSLTRRMSYDVRANTDKNLFIVDDYYDLDYDIAAFNKSLNNSLQLFATQYTSVREKILTVAHLLDLEVFCDSQGHIRTRPPQYNRVPSSIFNRMMYLKKVMNIRVFPQFLDKMFTDQLEALRQNIEIIEDQIRLDCAVLGQYPSLDLSGDIAAQFFIDTSSSLGNLAALFGFVSDSSGIITNISNLIKQANGERPLNEYDLIAGAAKSKAVLFGTGEQYTVLMEALQAQNQIISGDGNPNSAPSTNIFQSTVVQNLITRLQTKSGFTISSSDYLISAGPNQPLEIDTTQTVDLFKVTNDLATHLQSWQKSIKAFYHTIKNAAEYKSLDDDATTSNALQNPGLYQNSYIPEVYEHMIEDETYDDYGLNSGQRYIIKNAQILNLSIAARPPEFSSIEVQGTFDYFAENSGPPGMESFPGSGNALVSAIAVDYDMWRNFGFKSGPPVKAPFLSDPNTQAGPYASILLNRNRHSILRGTCTIVGNEFMQPGEVVFLQPRNLLFYVNSVTHSFTAGSGFTTTLDLTYGHAVGDYIPSIMDSVGKLIYKNQESAHTIIHRQDSSRPEKSVGVIQLNGQQPSASILPSQSDSDATNSYAVSNQQVITNILYSSAYVINSNGTAGKNVDAYVEIRVYYDSNNPLNHTLFNTAYNVLNELVGVTQNIKTSPIANQPVQNPPLSAAFVSVVEVDLGDAKDGRSPSQQAISAARVQMENCSTNIGSPSSSNPSGDDDGTNASVLSASNDALRKALCSYIIDCWIVFKPNKLVEEFGF